MLKYRKNDSWQKGTKRNLPSPLSHPPLNHTLPYLNRHDLPSTMALILPGPAVVLCCCLFQLLHNPKTVFSWWEPLISTRALPNSTAHATRGCRNARNTVTAAQPLATTLAQHEESWRLVEEVIKKDNWEETSGTCTPGAQYRRQLHRKGERW